MKPIDGTNTRECVVEVRYDLPPAEGESDEEAKRRAKRHREREQEAISYPWPRGHGVQAANSTFSSSTQFVNIAMF